MNLDTAGDLITSTLPRILKNFQGHESKSFLTSSKLYSVILIIIIIVLHYLLGLNKKILFLECQDFFMEAVC